MKYSEAKAHYGDATIARAVATHSKHETHNQHDIHIKKSHEGLLHKDTNTPIGKKIPAAKIEKAAHSSSPAVRKRAVFAENFGKKR